MAATLSPLVRQAEVIHVHSIWMAPEVIAAREATRIRRPWLVTFHGMVQPSEFARKRWKKLTYWRWVGAPTFGAADLVHAITLAERDVLHAILPGARIEVIPNGLDVCAADAEGAAVCQEPDRRCIMFFGRVAPGKGVDRLIAAFGRAGLAREWHIDVVGPCAPDYRAELQSLAHAENLGGRVHFVGPVRGAEKWACLKRAWLAAMPSVSEVVGMANLEAASAGVPTLVGPGCGLLDWAESGGMMVAPEVEPLAKALRAAAAWTDEERDHRGRGLRSLIERRYSAPVVGRQLGALYRELAAGGGCRP